MPWTPLAPSRREDALRRAAGLAALLGAGLLGVATLLADPIRWSLVALAALAAVGAVAASRRRPVRRIEVGIDAGGRIAARRTDRPPEAAPHRLQCVFAAAWLITLRQGTMLIPIWPDSVPGHTFRRLWVHLRWNSGRDRGGASLPAVRESRHRK